MTMEEVNGKIDKSYDGENVSNYWGLSKYFSIDIMGRGKLPVLIAINFSYLLLMKQYFLVQKKYFFGDC